MKMSRKDPRASMSKSAKGKSPINSGGRNPIKSASPYEVTGVGEGAQVRSAAPKPDPVVNDDTDTGSED